MACLIVHSVVFAFCKTKINAEKFNKTLILNKTCKGGLAIPCSARSATLKYIGIQKSHWQKWTWFFVVAG
jgi:hypothetical protein